MHHIHAAAAYWLPWLMLLLSLSFTIMVSLLIHIIVKFATKLTRLWKINEFMIWLHAAKLVKLVQCQLHKNIICHLGCFNSPQKAVLALSSLLSSFPSHVWCMAWLWSCYCYCSYESSDNDDVDGKDADGKSTNTLNTNTKHPYAWW